MTKDDKKTAVGVIEDRWAKLESELASDIDEADALIHWFSRAFRYAGIEPASNEALVAEPGPTPASDATQVPPPLPGRRKPSRSWESGLFPREVAHAYVYDGDSILRAWRRYLGLTIEELSARSGVGAGRLFLMERSGRIPGGERIRLAAALGIVPEMLFLREPSVSRRAMPERPDPDT